MKLFDPQGRLIPSENERVYSAHDRGYFSLAQPVIDYVRIHSNLGKFFGNPAMETLSAEAFQDRAESLGKSLLEDERTSDLFQGVHVPFLLPPGTAGGNSAKEFDERWLSAVGRAFADKFPDFEFRNYLKGQLEGDFPVIPDVRYESLLKAAAQGGVVGWYFPTCLAGFAIPDQRKLMRRLPERLILSGPVEAASAFVGTPELLMRTSNYPNLLALGAVKPPQDHLFYFFEAYGWNLTFNQRSMIGAVSEYYAGGLSVIA